MNKLLGGYKNGNYNTLIFNDGTKIRKTKEERFVPAFPECIDIKITNYCDMNCPYCHEASNIEGEHAELLDVKFIETLSPYTELAIGGGNPLSHPELLNFLRLLKSKNIIANMTVNQKHFEDNLNYIENLMNNDLIKGLGISLREPTQDFLNKIENMPNVVLHVINGVIKKEDMQKMYDKNLKVLILGYKQFRRGNEYYSETVEKRKKEMYDNLREIIEKFQVVSFDNLAIEQLDVRRLMTHEEWNEFYMGDDGQFTMYIDMVSGSFAKSSVSTDRYELLDNIVDMFQKVRNEKCLT